MKKYILLLVLSLGLTSFSSAFQEGENIFNDGTNTINAPAGSDYYINKYSNSNLSGTVFGTGVYATGTHNITVVCKNGYIDTISGAEGGSASSSISKDLYSYKLEKLGVGYHNTGYNDNYATIRCKPITSPAREIDEKVLDINYQTISQKTNSLQDEFPITKNGTYEITAQDVQDKLSAGKDVDNQPSFIDILYLQLKTLANLSDSIILEKDIDFKDLFKTDSDFEDYNKWIDKFSVFSTKKDFQDAFSGAVTLKDIGIAQDVLFGLYDCINNNNCSKTINFKHKVFDKFDLYTMDEIGLQLYTGNNNILDASINYYDNLKDACNGNNINDDFFKNQVNNVCNKLINDNIENISNDTNFNLGYSLGVRVKNLNNIKSNISGSGLSLKGIFNIYWELNNLTLGTDKVAIVKKVIEEPTLTGKYENLREVFEKDLEELNNKKVEDNTKLLEKEAIITTAIQALTPGTTLNNALQTSSPTTDLFDDSNYTNNNGVVSINGISTTTESDEVENEGFENLDPIEFEKEEDFPYRYKELILKYNDGDEVGYKKITFFSVLDNWYYKIGIYIKESDKGNYIEEMNKCKNNENNITCYNTYGVEVCIYNSDYYNCIDSVNKKFDRIEIYWYRWKYYARYIEGED